MPDNSVDLIIADPPYGINYRSKHGSKEYKERVQSHEWDKDFNFKKYFKILYDKLKNNSFMYIFGRHENIRLMQELKCDRILVWDKGHCGMGDLIDWGIGYELIFLWKKGRPKLRGKRINGVIYYKHIGFFEKTLHPTMKPLGVINILLKKSSDKNDIVLDPFLGSGTTAVACKMLNRSFIGFELSEAYCEIARKRLKAVPEKLSKWFD